MAGQMAGSQPVDDAPSLINQNNMLMSVNIYDIVAVVVVVVDTITFLRLLKVWTKLHATAVPDIDRVSPSHTSYEFAQIVHTSMGFDCGYSGLLYVSNVNKIKTLCAIRFTKDFIPSHHSPVNLTYDLCSFAFSFWNFVFDSITAITFIHAFASACHFPLCARLNPRTQYINYRRRTRKMRNKL